MNLEILDQIIEQCEAMSNKLNSSELPLCQIDIDRLSENLNDKCNEGTIPLSDLLIVVANLTSATKTVIRRDEEQI